ncbi:expressed unknown protein [Seminavis robusta]|uniref:Uncharacterized protein n=1 Tax=Seminavis robusta TaxID=568900 RepID=A0A9N8DXN1_9STRA|nr:expressed unknown protein [Seminavis robusta]|eukprot:Sro426_g140380.1 n/a (462) ;mRNA; r:23244-24843
MVRPLTAIAVVALTALGTTGFSVSQLSSRHKRGGFRPISASIFNSDGDSPAEELLRARTCVGNLLTQRAIQSFMFLLLSCRDPHTVHWLQNCIHTENLEHFHGTGAFNLTRFPNWDSVLVELLSQPKTTMVATKTTRRGGGGRGWRGQIDRLGLEKTEQPKEERQENPHIHEQIVNYEIDIDPVSLVSRIVSVREQIAAECNSDFDTLIYANDQILASYFETQQHDRSEEEDATENGNTTHEDEDEDDSDHEDLHDSLTIPYSDSSKSGRRPIEGHKNAFDRYNAMMLLSHAMDIGDDGIKPSPLRKGNFDLMLLLSTQESIHRVLRDYAHAGDERDVSFTWLSEFYLERVNEFFDGHQEYGRADDFLEELLLTPPMLKSWDDDGGSRKEMVGLVDPLRMAEDIIRMRSEVGREWKQIIASTPKEHMKLRKALLVRQMGDQQTEFDTTIPETTMEMSEGFE